MKKLLFVNACIRGEDSRTWRIAAPLIEKLRETYEVQTIDVNALQWQAVRAEEFQARGQGNFQEHVLEYARMMEQTDRLVIAAPFWDMSFPSALKVFFEQISLDGYTFDNGSSTCTGRCRCEKVLYITTRGMNIPTGDIREQAVPYLRALSTLWGLGEVQCVACENMDYISDDEREEKIQKAITEGMEICREF